MITERVEIIFKNEKSIVFKKPEHSRNDSWISIYEGFIRIRTEDVNYYFPETTIQCVKEYRVMDEKEQYETDVNKALKEL